MASPYRIALPVRSRLFKYNSSAKSDPSLSHGDLCSPSHFPSTPTTGSVLNPTMDSVVNVTPCNDSCGSSSPETMARCVLWVETLAEAEKELRVAQTAARSAALRAERARMEVEALKAKAAWERAEGARIEAEALTTKAARNDNNADPPSMLAPKLAQLKRHAGAASAVQTDVSNTKESMLRWLGDMDAGVSPSKYSTSGEGQVLIDGAESVPAMPPRYLHSDISRGQSALSTPPLSSYSTLSSERSSYTVKYPMRFVRCHHIPGANEEPIVPSSSPPPSHNVSDTHASLSYEGHDEPRTSGSGASRHPPRHGLTLQQADKSSHSSLSGCRSPGELCASHTSSPFRHTEPASPTSDTEPSWLRNAVSTRASTTVLASLTAVAAAADNDELFLRHLSRNIELCPAPSRNSNSSSDVADLSTDPLPRPSSLAARLAADAKGIEPPPPNHVKLLAAKASQGIEQPPPNHVRPLAAKAKASVTEAKSVTADFTFLLSETLLSETGILVEDCKLGEQVRIYSLDQLVVGRAYLTSAGNSLCRTSRYEALLAHKVTLRLNNSESEQRRCYRTSRDSSSRSSQIVPESPAHMLNARSTAVVKLQCAVRGMLARGAVASKENERARKEWIAYYVGYGKYDEARELGWTGHEKLDECVIS